jgi:hypothetical protein
VDVLLDGLCVLAELEREYHRRCRRRSSPVLPLSLRQNPLSRHMETCSNLNRATGFDLTLRAGRVIKENTTPGSDTAAAPWALVLTRIEKMSAMPIASSPIRTESFQTKYSKLRQREGRRERILRSLLIRNPIEISCTPSLET